MKDKGKLNKDQLATDINELIRKNSKGGVIDGLALSGSGCDVKKGPCACGAWH